MNKKKKKNIETKNVVEKGGKGQVFKKRKASKKERKGEEKSKLRRSWIDAKLMGVYISKLIIL